MRPIVATARITALALGGAASLAVCVGAVAAGWLLSLGMGGATPEGAWVARGPLLVMPLWLPGVWIALRLRAAWPALGPGDEALGWLARHGAAAAVPRLGALAGAGLALLLLQGATALAIGLAAGTESGRPSLRLGQELSTIGSSGVLVRSGDEAVCDLPARAGTAVLRIEPRYYFGAAATRAAVKVDATVVVDARERPLGALLFADFGAAAETTIPKGPACRVVLRRASAEGPALSVKEGRILLAGTPVSTATAAVVLAVRHLPWAVLLLLLSLASARFLEPPAHAVAILGASPLVALLPGVEAPAAPLELARGLILWPSPPGLMVWSVAVGLLVAGLLPPSRTFAGEGEA